MDYSNQRIKSIIRDHSDTFLEKSNVIGVAYGEKYVNGLGIRQTCVHVLVEKKLPVDEIKPEDLVPEQFLGERTDVIEVGTIKSVALTSRVRPMLFGYSIGPSNLRLAGTAGCLVYDANNYYILSNNHVMAGENTNPIGTPILQPATIDGGIVSRDVVANLTRFVTINFTTSKSTPVNYVDAAIAKIVNVTNIVSRNIVVIGPVRDLGAPSINLPVRKSGRTTGYLAGNIISLGATVNVGYSGGKVAQFRNQIVTTAISQPGDSGSLVVDNNSKAIGLLFAGSSTVTILNPIGTVISSLGVKLAVN